MMTKPVYYTCTIKTKEFRGLKAAQDFAFYTSGTIDGPLFDYDNKAFYIVIYKEKKFNFVTKE